MTYYSYPIAFLVVSGRTIELSVLRSSLRSFFGWFGFGIPLPKPLMLVVVSSSRGQNGRSSIRWDVMGRDRNPPPV